MPAMLQAVWGYVGLFGLAAGLGLGAVQATPLNEHEESINPDGPETMTAYTRDISPSGVGFLHDQPISSNRVLLSFELLGGKTLSLVIQLTWCRYLGDFWHSSGGRLVGLVMPPSQNSLEDLEVDELST